jgi:GDP-D-mannose dehydratase
MPCAPTDQSSIRIDPRYFCPTEVETLLGDPTKAKERLGWVPKTDLAQGLALAYEDFVKNSACAPSKCLKPNVSLE